jgi:hypothetical protein
MARGLMMETFKQKSTAMVVFVSLSPPVLEGNVFHHRAGQPTEPATFFYTKKGPFLAPLS